MATADDDVMDSYFAETVAHRNGDITDLLAAGIYPGNGTGVNPGGASIVGKIDFMAESTQVIEADSGQKVRVVRSHGDIHYRQKRGWYGLGEMLCWLGTKTDAVIAAFPDSGIWRRWR